jgi:hypothetical protein
MHVAHLGELFGEKVLLETRGEAQLFVQPVHVKFQRLVAPAKHVDLGAEGFYFGLSVIEGVIEMTFEGDDAGDTVNGTNVVIGADGSRTRGQVRLGNQPE